MGLGKEKGLKPNLADPDVERVRRNHLNDIENVVPFVLIGLAYVACNPSAGAALWHFRIFFFSRILHTFSYQVEIIADLFGLISVFFSRMILDSSSTTKSSSDIYDWIYHYIIDGYTSSS